MKILFMKVVLKMKRNDTFMFNASQSLYGDGIVAVTMMEDGVVVKMLTEDEVLPLKVCWDMREVKS